VLNHLQKLGMLHGAAAAFKIKLNQSSAERPSNQVELNHLKKNGHSKPPNGSKNNRRPQCSNNQFAGET